MSRKNYKRKRRSFWEPDSRQIVEWMDAQDDLGNSLQLIIRDAIASYGHGDVVKMFLNQRDALLDQSQPSAGEHKQHRPAQKQARASVKPDIPPSKPVQVEQAETSQNQSQTRDKPRSEPERETSQTSKTPEPVPSSSEQPTALSDNTDGEENDPIKVMMEDIGSQFSE